MRFSTALRQIGHSAILSPHIWQVPCPHRNIMFFRRSIHTGQLVCKQKYIIYENQKQPWVPDWKISVESGMPPHNPNQASIDRFKITAGTDVLGDKNETLQWGHKKMSIVFYRQGSYARAGPMDVRNFDCCCLGVTCALKRQQQLLFLDYRVMCPLVYRKRKMC